jgi:signal transduction histidine kinase
MSVSAWKRPPDMQKKIRNISFVFWMLLIYIIAALGWWYIALQNINKNIYSTAVSEAKEELGYQRISLQQHDELLHKAENIFNRKTAQYIGEGSIFLLIILIGAVFVFRSLKKQLLVTAQQQNFVMAVTHELKTPIAVAKLNLETLLKRKLEEPQKEKLIQNTIGEINRLNDLINNILLASQIEGGNYILNEEPVNLSELSRKIVKDFSIRFPERKTETGIEENIFVRGDKMLLEIAINNIVENAIRYSPRESTIYVDLTDEDDRYSLEITDEGYGIPEEEKVKVFNKFYRIGNENTRKTKGTGLGLFLTKKILQDHNAGISLSDNTPHGSIFAINFFKS